MSGGRRLRAELEVARRGLIETGAMLDLHGRHHEPRVPRAVVGGAEHVFGAPPVTDPNMRAEDGLARGQLPGMDVMDVLDVRKAF